MSTARTLINYIELVKAKVPDELKGWPVWLCWRSIPNRDPRKKPRKKPFYANGKSRGEGLKLDCPEDREQLVTFDQALAAFERSTKYTGLGVALGPVPGTDKVLSGIDLDNVAPSEPRVMEVMSAANSYTETSPSGTGLKIFGIGNIGTVKESANHIEIYSGERFFAVTGCALNGALLANLSDAAQIARRLFLPVKATQPQSATLPQGVQIGPGAHNHLLALAGRIRRTGLESEEILAALRVYNDKHCVPPKPDKELQDIAAFVANKPAPEFESPLQLLGPESSIGSYDEWHGFPFEPPNIVANYLPEDAGGSVGPGGYGKTTLALYESVLIRLGRPLYGREVVRSGPTLFITAEDRREIVFSRLNEICRALLLSGAEVEHVRKGLFIEDVTGTLARIAQADRYGIVQPGILLSEVIDKYSDAELAAVILDPTSLLGPGESFGNDGAAELLRISRMLARRLRTAVRLIHHVGQGVAREGIQDQYAARGGTAFVDNSRFQHQLVVVNERSLKVKDWGTFRVPNTATETDIKKGRVLALLVHKLSYEERDRVPIFLLRKRFEFIHMTALEGDMTKQELDQQTAEDIERLRVFLVMKLAEKIYITAEQMEKVYPDEFKMPRPRLRKAIKEAGDAIVLTDLPADGGRQGARKQYLRPAPEQAM